MRVEKEIFTSLFRLAMEDVDMFPEMRSCMDRMPWEELHGIDNGPESAWFKSEIRDGEGSHSFRTAASRALEIQPFVRPSISFPRHLALPSSSSSSHRHQTNLGGRRIRHASEPEDVTVNVDHSTNTEFQGEARVSPDAMDVDKESLYANPQRPGNYSGATLRTIKEIARANIALPQIHRLRLKVSRPKPLLKGKKRAMVEDGEEREEEDDSDDSDKDEEEEEEEETVCGQTQPHS